MDSHRSTGTNGVLEGLILRAEEVLGKMLLKLQRTRMPLEEKVRMINALHAFVEQWEGALADVKLPPELQQLGQSPPSKPKSHGDEIMDVMQKLGLNGDDGGGGRSVKNGGRSVVAVPVPQEEAEPVFEVLEQSLKEYSPGQPGTCFVTYTCPGSRRFFMMDRTDRDEADRTDRLLASLQNVTNRREDLPDSARRIFGVEVKGETFRAVRSRSEPAWLWLLDTGAVLPYEESMLLFELPDFYRRQEPLARCCELVDVTDRKFRGGDLARFLEVNLFCGREFEVVRVRGKVLHVNLGRAVARKRNGVVKKVREEPTAEYRISEKTLTQEQLDVLYEEPLGTTNAMKATMGYIPKDDTRICPHYEPALEGCFKGSRCKLLHVAKDPDGWTRDQTLHKVKIRAQLNEPKVGSVVHMIPTTIVNVEEFYAHLDVTENGTKLTEMQALLNDPRNVKTFRPLDHKPYTREYVIARYAEDGQWYRAEVLDYFHDGLVVVLYLDYGNQERLGMADLRTWDDRFDYLPFQAVHCRLANVTRKRGGEGEEEEEAEDIQGTLALREVIYDKRVAVKVLDVRSYWEVLVYDGCGIDVGEFLVNRKVALPRNPIVIDDAEAWVPA
ncbi:tudor and KH domain-containing protein isoform X2 [Culex quinquefasciatus]|uniref:tudor and KH domain-containing protein isoform X2 n=1 Tax=Culex quinquefasciatus TaxID=7176 RepID=UPI0018E33248|nr:tudor and KH domain-containing protein isoform X2 [Culex quinquefasciatus]